MHKVYCDSGGFRKELKELEASGVIELVYSPIENRNKNIIKISNPTNLTWNDLKHTKWKEMKFPWNEFQPSDKYTLIGKVIGRNNERDIKHLDSAYKSKCTLFITSDKDDMVSHKKEIHQLLDLEVYHFIDDWPDFLNQVSNKKR